MVALPDRVTKYRTKRGKIAAARHLLRGYNYIVKRKQAYDEYIHLEKGELN